MNLLQSVEPLTWITAATVAARDVIPTALVQTGLSHAVPKAELRPGDHVYAWKLGYTYNHHGIVVNIRDCSHGCHCHHETLDCCSIVHFLPPSGQSPGRIELTSFADFAQGRSVCRCRYGVPDAEFYLKRAGICSTLVADARPLVILRALSLIDLRNFGSPDDADDICAQTEYGLLTKNSELLASWARVGERSGVRRFNSSEAAFSPQTSPGRFARLGLAVAVSAAATVAVVAVSGAATGAAAGASAGAATGAVASSTSTASAGSAAVAAGPSTAVVAANPMTISGVTTVATDVLVRSSSLVLQTGVLAASGMARALLVDIARRPQNAIEAVSCAVPSTIQMPTAASRTPSILEARRYVETQHDTLILVLKSLFQDLGVQVPKPLTPVFDSAYGCRILCEILVDVLEAAGQLATVDIATSIQTFLVDLQV